jgi:hypothetical protein
MRLMIFFVLLLCTSWTAAEASSDVRFGVVTKLDQGMFGKRTIDLILDAGVSTNRDVVSWQKIERSNGHYLWDPQNVTMFSALKDRGIKTVLVLTMRNELYDDGDFPKSTAAIAAFGRFAAYVAEQLRGQTVAFEIGNEVRLTRTFRPADYARIFVAAANAIHAVDPKVAVVVDPAVFAKLPATAIPAPGTPLGDAARSALRVADGVAVHQYPYQRAGMTFAQTQAAMVSAMTRRAAWLATLAGRPTPLYVTEFGWPQLTQRGLNAEEQARQLAITTRALAAMPFVKMAIVYELADSCTNPANVECTFGLYARRASGLVPKPALQAFRDAVAGVGR